MSACPSKESLEQFLSDRLSAADEQAVSLHIEHCPACQQHLEARTQLTRPVRRPDQTEASRGGV